MGQEATEFSILEEGRALMLENDSWALLPDDLFLDSKTPGNCLKGNFVEPMDKVSCENDAILNSSDDGNNSSLYDFPVAGISPANGDLNIFGNDQENQECSYLSYDGWPDISYIEGIDGLFRSCDSSSRQETVTNDNEMSWFSSSPLATDGFAGALESSLKSYCTDSSALKIISQHHEPSVYHVSHSEKPDSYKKNVLSYYSTVAHSSYGDSLGVNAESILKPYSDEQAFKANGVIENNVFPVIKTNNGSSEMHGRLRSKHIKNHRPESKREDQSLEYSNGSSFVVSGTSQQFSNPMKMSSEFSSNVKPLTSGKTGYNLYWKHCGQATSSIRSHDEDTVGHAASPDQVPIVEHPQQIEIVVDGHCEVEKVCKELLDMDAESSAALEGSGLSSEGSDKMSLEENSFQQLQYVMEQLDLRTKLCIRDGLYRLAQSADQRNKIGHLGVCRGDGRDEHGLMISHEPNKCGGFMDVETGTNLIDRSIAHLLFHKPITDEPPETCGSLSFAYDHCHNSNFTF